jgi:SPP1 family predicted phage head-tail adaptor
MKRFPIGPRRYLVTLQTGGNATQNTFGEAIPTSTTNVQMWASIDSLRGQELFAAAQQIQAKVSVKISMRYTALSPKDSIVYGSRTFNVEWVDLLDQRQKWLVAYCTENITGGQ